MMASGYGGWGVRPGVMLVLVLCLVGHVSMCMGREVGDLSARSGRRIMEQSHGDGWCKSQGQAVASIAYGYACHKLKIMCHVKDPNQDNSNNDKDKDKDKEKEENKAEASKKGLFFDGLSPHCLREAEGSCRAAVTKLINDQIDPECSKLLDEGPDQPVEHCWNWIDTVNEFNWTIREVCQQDDASVQSTENSGR